MSIKDLKAPQSKVKLSGSPLESPLQDNAQKPVAWFKRWPASRKGPITPGPSYLPLLFCLLIALLVRGWLVIHTQGFIDGDEALVGIQAAHILRGELPIYFYNQPYMGSLEAYIMAAIFAIVGPSVWALRAEPILLSLVAVWLTWKLASALADTAHLPLYAKQWFMSIAALLAAIPPLYDTVLELRMLGGYIEVFILMLLLLLSVLKLTTRRAAGASRRELTWRWAGIGFIAGFGFWVNPLITYGILAAALWLAWDCVKSWKQSRGTTNTNHRNVGAGLAPALNSPTLRTPSTFALRTTIPPTLASIPACIVGLAPALYWGTMNQWHNFTYVLQLSANASIHPLVQARYPTRLDLFLGLTHLYTTCLGPRIVGGALPGENPLLKPLYTPTLVLGGLSILVTSALVALSFVQPHPLLLRVRRLAALPVVFGSSVSIIFCATQTAAIGLGPCQIDLAGRYATPLMLILPFFVATIFTAVVMLEADVYRADQEQALDGGSIKAATGAMDVVRTEDTKAALSRRSSPATTGSRPQRAILGLLVGLLVLSVYLQVAFYGLSDAGSTFQSPYCTQAPVNNDAIISYMLREHIHYAWANNWIAFPIDFKTQERIIISDPLAIIRNNPTLNRIPAYTEAILHADRPSFLVFVRHNDSYPKLLQLLDAGQVTYQTARFPAQEGHDVLVVTPLNRTVSPFDGDKFLTIFFCTRYSKQ
jgi:hypothetical protein